MVQCTCFPAFASSSDWHTRTAAFKTLAYASHCTSAFGGPINVCPILFPSVRSRSLHAIPASYAVVVCVEVPVVVGVVVVVGEVVCEVVGDEVPVVTKQSGK